MSTKEGAESGGVGGSMCLNTAVATVGGNSISGSIFAKLGAENTAPAAGSSTQYANLLFLFSVYVRAKLLTVSLELRIMNNKLKHK